MMDRRSTFWTLVTFRGLLDTGSTVENGLPVLSKGSEGRCGDFDTLYRRMEVLRHRHARSQPRSK